MSKKLSSFNQSQKTSTGWNDRAMLWLVEGGDTFGQILFEFGFVIWILL